MLKNLNIDLSQEKAQELKAIVMGLFLVDEISLDEEIVGDFKKHFGWFDMTNEELTNLALNSIIDAISYLQYEAEVLEGITEAGSYFGLGSGHVFTD